MKLLIVSLAAALLLLNCKKNILVAEPKAATVFNKRPATITTDNAENFNLLYDQQGRLLVHTAGNTVHYYKPGSDHFLTQLNKGSNVKSAYRHAQRDASGRIIKLEMYVLDENEKTVEFIYTKDGFLERQKVVVAGSGDKIEFIYYYAQGNLEKIQERHNNELKTTVMFEYDHERRNSVDVDFFDFKQIGFVTDAQFGHQSKNLVKSVQAISADKQTVISFQHFYKMDATGSVQSMAIETNNEIIKKYKFIY